MPVLILGIRVVRVDISTIQLNALHDTYVSYPIKQPSAKRAWTIRLNVQVNNLLLSLPDRFEMQEYAHSSYLHRFSQKRIISQADRSHISRFRRLEPVPPAKRRNGETGQSRL